MRCVFRCLIMSSVLLAALPAAATEIVLGVHGGYGAYTQEDLNGAIGGFNAEARADVAPEVKGGIEYGGHFGMRVNETTILGVAYCRLQAATDGAAAGSWVDLSVPADCWLAFLSWLPDSDKVGRLGLGADAGFVTTSGDSESQIAGSEPEIRHFEGQGLFLAAYVVGDLALSSGLSLLAQGGFRLAQVPDVLAGSDAQYDLDYSGVFVRLGLRYAP